jgi:hypothetical protein
MTFVEGNVGTENVLVAISQDSLLQCAILRDLVSISLRSLSEGSGRIEEPRCGEAECLGRRSPMKILSRSATGEKGTQDVTVDDVSCARVTATGRAGIEVRTAALRELFRHG